MTLKNQLIILLVCSATAYAIGRYSASLYATVYAKTDVAQTKNIDKDTHEQTTKVETKKPDGSEVITTVTNKDTVTAITDTKDTRTQTETITKPTVSLSALAGYDFNKKAPTYGAAVSKQVLGPISLGAWGLTNGTVGISLGLEF